MKTALMIAAIWLGAATSAVAGSCDIGAEGFERAGAPVLRDPIPSENYEAASDPHAVSTDEGLVIIYSGDDGGQISTKLARADGQGGWALSEILLGRNDGPAGAALKETPFYRRAANGEHQIYFIGYDDETTYRSQVYLAVADDLAGPYEILPEPVVPLGIMDGKDVRLITSPSIVEHDGQLHMAFLAWNGFEDVTAVWALGGTSDDNGRSWQGIREVAVPIGMEGQISARPGGGYVAVAASEYGDGEGIMLGCADHPFGPYDGPDAPLLAQTGKGWEKDEITAPQMFFDENGAPTLFYTGADHQKGWWIMQAAAQ